MTTDTVRSALPPLPLLPHSRIVSQALGVTSLIVSPPHKTLSTITFVDHPTIRFDEHEGVEMPFRYIVDDKTGEPILPDGMREHLKCVHPFLLVEGIEGGEERLTMLCVCRADMDRGLDDF